MQIDFYVILLNFLNLVLFNEAHLIQDSNIPQPRDISVSMQIDCYGILLFFLNLVFFNEAHLIQDSNIPQPRDISVSFQCGSSL